MRRSEEVGEQGIVVGSPPARPHLEQGVEVVAHDDRTVLLLQTVRACREGGGGGAPEQGAGQRRASVTGGRAPSQADLSALTGAGPRGPARHSCSRGWEKTPSRLGQRGAAAAPLHTQSASGVVLTSASRALSGSGSASIASHSPCTARCCAGAGAEESPLLHCGEGQRHGLKVWPLSRDPPALWRALMCVPIT